MDDQIRSIEKCYQDYLVVQRENRKNPSTQIVNQDFVDINTRPAGLTLNHTEEATSSRYFDVSSSDDDVSSSDDVPQLAYLSSCPPNTPASSPVSGHKNAPLSSRTFDFSSSLKTALYKLKTEIQKKTYGSQPKTNRLHKTTEDIKKTQLKKSPTKKKSKQPDENKSDPKEPKKIPEDFFTKHAKEQPCTPQ